jgi:hypothetical protein
MTKETVFTEKKAVEKKKIKEWQDCVMEKTWKEKGYVKNKE